MAAAEKLSPLTSLAQLTTLLDQCDRVLEAAELWTLANRLQLTANELDPFIAFCPHQFSHRPVYLSSSVEIGCICWRSGQQSAIHDHRGSACCVRVVEGTLTNIDYRLDDGGRLTAARSSQWRPAEVLSRPDRRIHRCANEQPQESLITLHLYSPPLVPLSERAYAGLG